MQHLSTLLALLAAASVSSLPLNINLGAFSPALVVGDGEISFGGEADVSSLMTALSGASQGAAAAEGETTADNLTGAQVVPATPVVEVQPSASTVPIAPAALQGQGIGRSIEPRLPEAAADSVSVEKEKRDLEEAKREVEERDLAGFNAALAFATGALKTGPEIQLGTGEGGSGVGIIVKAGSENGGAAAEGTVAERAVVVGKREDGNLPTVTMLKVRTVGDSSAITKTRRNVKSRAAVEDDAVNLNLAGDGQQYELTIAEVKP